MTNRDPAFPIAGNVCPNSDYGLAGHSGMTLRDWFAGQALQAFVTLYAFGQTDRSNPASCAAEVARLGYQLADAMLAQREAPK